MFGIESFQVFLLAAVVICLVPGVDTMYILSRSMSQGKTAGVYSVLGISTGCVVHTILAAIGLSAILQASTLLFTILKSVGAVYLIYLGIQSLFQKQTPKTTIQLTTVSKKRLYTQGLITNVTNPKVALFFISFVPQFIVPDNHYGPVPFILLGATFVLLGTIWDLALVAFASFITKKLRESMIFESILNKLSGVVFIILGISLFTSKAH